MFCSNADGSSFLMFLPRFSDFFGNLEYRHRLECSANRLASVFRGRCLPRHGTNDCWVRLAERGTEAVFNPLSFDAWMQLAEPRQSSTPLVGDSEGELVAPIEWQVHQAVVPDEPTELWVELWNASRIQMLTWIIFGFCLSLGILLRMFGWSHRDLLAGYWLGICCAAACSVSAPYAGILGGAIAGTLIALLIPRQLLRKTVLVDDVTVERRRSAHGIVITSLLGGLTFFARIRRS